MVDNEKVPMQCSTGRSLCPPKEAATKTPGKTREGGERGGDKPTRSGLSVEGGCRGEEIPGWHTVITGRKREMMAKMSVEK